MDFYTRLKMLIEQRNLTVTQFCADIGLSRDSFNKLVKRNNYPRLDMALRMANYLKVSLDFLADNQPKDGLSDCHQHLIEAVKQLPEEKLESVTILVDGLVASEHLKKESIA